MDAGRKDETHQKSHPEKYASDDQQDPNKYATCIFWGPKASIYIHVQVVNMRKTPHTMGKIFRLYMEHNVTNNLNF